MNAAAPGWYPDPEHAAMLRWYDGTQWTDHRQPAIGPGPVPPPAKRKMSTGAIVLIVVGSLVAAVIALGVLAAIAIPVFLDQRDKATLADLRSLTCADVGKEAVRYSQQSVTGDEIPLSSADSMVLVTDARATLRLPEKGESLVMRCSGSATWADAATTTLVVDLYTNQHGDHLFALDWDE